MKYADEEALPESETYYVWEQRWLNKPDTMPRYMRAAKWKFDDAKKRLKATLEWRREYKPDLIPPDEVSRWTIERPLHARNARDNTLICIMVIGQD